MEAGASVNVGDLVIEHSTDPSRMISAMLGEDEIGAIVRCHFEAEQAINHVLKKLSNGRSKRVEGWQSFANKLEVCRVLGIGENMCAPLKLLNDHRNEFAHNGRESLAAGEVVDLFRLVSRAYPQFTQEFRFVITGKNSFDRPYKECSNKEKYVMSCAIAINLFASMPQVLEKLQWGSSS